MLLNEYCEKAIDEEILTFFKRHEFAGLKLKLLVFVGSHPETSFNLDDIAHAMEITRHNSMGLLKELISKGIINERYYHCPGGIAHYSLNPDHECSSYIKELSQMGLSEINITKGELERSFSIFGPHGLMD